MFVLKNGLLNTQAHELISLEVLTLLLQNPTGDSVEVAVSKPLRWYFRSFMTQRRH